MPLSPVDPDPSASSVLPAAAPAASDWMTVRQAAALLADISQAVVYRLYDRGELLGAKIAGRIKLRRSSVEAYLATHSNEKAPAGEAEALQTAAQELTEQQQPERKRRRRARQPAGFQHYRP
jgi:excisionase family DNA binding protein